MNQKQNLLKIENKILEKENEKEKGKEKDKEKDNEKDKEDTFKDLLLEWIGNSSSHALPRLFKNITMPLKVFWFIFMIICWSAACYFIIIYFIDYFKYEVNVGVELIDERPTMFPTIDICNIAPYDGNTKIDDVISEIKQNEGLGGTSIGDPPSAANQQNEFFYDDLSIFDVKVNTNLSYIDLNNTSLFTTATNNSTNMSNNSVELTTNPTDLTNDTISLTTISESETTISESETNTTTTTTTTSTPPSGRKRKKRYDYGINSPKFISNDDTENKAHHLLNRKKRSNSIIDVKYALNLKLKSDALIKSYLIALENREANGQINLTNYGYQLKDLLLGCKFRGVYCTANDFSMYHNYNYGNCFRFNGGKNALNQNVTLKKTIKAGWRYGLQLELFTGFNDVYSAARGFRILIHNHTDEYTFPDEDGINVEPGKLTSISIKKTYVERLDTPFNDCLDDLTQSKYNYLIRKSHILDIMKNRFNYKIYNQNLCMKICLQKYIYEKCGCIDLSLPAYFSNQRGLGCNTRMELICAGNTEIDFFNSNEVAKCEVQCPNKCKFFLYNTKVSMSNYPSDWFVEKNPNSQINETLYKTRVSNIYLFYNQMIYKHIYQTEAITAEMLFANFGGQLGLFMGISLLSCVELIELVIFISFFLFKKFKNIKVKANT